MNQFQKYNDTRILLVDDEEFCLSSMQTIMRSIGLDVDHQVDSCIHGMEALDQVKETYRNKMRYQIIFTDFNMPVMNGIDSTKAMREFFREEGISPQPIIVGLTGHVQDEFKMQGINAGMDEILEKPLYSNDMRAVLKKYKI